MKIFHHDSDHIVSTGIMEQLYVFLSRIDLVLMRGENILVEMGDVSSKINQVELCC